ncbi:MAG: APC family permease [Candidatus Methanoplasma sp.]|jgi:amino acid transporter|nr:APC family permease [Candidatus Methanoplasma sp.]
MSDNETELARSISWKQGMLIALGVPILILPSLYDVAGILWAFSILMWTVSVLQGFLQNTAYGEMVTVFPRAAGLPGCAQIVFSPEKRTSRYDIGKFIGAFCAWSYWFAWTPVVAIFTILMGDYLVQLVDITFDPLYVYVVLGVIIVVAMTLIGSRGLSGGAVVGLVLALVAIIPLVAILVAAFITGTFDMGNISGEFLPIGWDWGPIDIVMLFGCFGLAQWSACAWETAAIYGPEYKDPGRDVPKALFSCGLICLVLYLFVSTAVFGSLGIDGVEDAGYATLVPIAKTVFGDIGGSVALVLLMAAMLLIIQTGFLGSSRTLYSMAREGNLPKFLAKVNRHGMPVVGMIVVSLVNLALISIGNPVAILAASGIAYCFAQIIALAAYVKSKSSPRFKDLPRPFSAPRGWKYVAACICIYELVVLLPCLLYWSVDVYGLQSVIIGAVILLVFIPVWFITQAKEAVMDGGSGEQ